MKQKSHPYIKGIGQEFLKHANRDNAIPMKQYMRNQFEFFGLKSDERRNVSRVYLNSKPLPAIDEMRTIIKELWTLPEREYQYFGQELLMKYKKEWSDKDIALIEFLAIHKSWWDTVNFLAANAAGAWFNKFTEQINKVTGKWNKSQNIWLQRMSILFQLKYKKETDLDLLSSYIVHLSGSGEFFVQKAIGWILREYSKTSREAVLKFVKSHELKPLSKREAMKVIDRKPKE